MSHSTPPAQAGSAASLPVRAVAGGFLMGLANLVPGISGGTMLLAAGVYPNFIDSIASVTTFRWTVRAFVTLGCIVAAALAAFVTLAGPVSQAVVDHRWIMYSLFIGLTLGGAPILWRMLRPVNPAAIVMVVAGFGLMTLLAFVDPADSSTGSADGHPYLLYAVAGLAGASAMVLPGISGGYLLLVLGQYVAILTAVSQMKDGLTARDWDLVEEALHVVIPVGIGVVVGIVGVSNLIRIFLAKFEKPTLGLLLGLLLGAVVGLWPFQAGVAPEAGSTFKGDTVAEVDGVLVQKTTGKEIDPADYPTEIFSPTAGEMGGAAGILLLGLGISLGVSRLGSAGEKADPDTTES